jgi:4-amino-4-deoxy-L-arabinose transferase-like glycosyltransferase
MTVVVTYLFARRAWGRLVAVLAAGLLAAYHFHIHYSRLALNNSWDPLFALLVMGSLWRGWQSGDRRYYVLGGLGLGISQYFYMGSRVLLVMVVGLIAYWLLTDRRRLWGQRGNLVAALLVTLVVGLPIALFSVSHPDDYLARVNQLGIYQSGWLQREMAMTGRAEADLLWEQGWKSALAFNYTVDTTFWYRPGIPLLRFWPSILFVFGLGLALAGARRTPNFTLLLWIGATVVFAGVLLENPPSSQRYVIAAPAVCLLVALPLAWMTEQLRRLLGGREEVWLGGVLLLGLWIARGDVSFYFADYTPHGDYGGLNTEVADRAADYLLDLGSEWQAYFYGPPRMGIERLRGFPTVSYLVPETDPVDVWEPVTDTSQLPDVRRPAVFMFLPERAGELEVIRRVFPGGTEKHFPGRFDRMLFLAYEVP